ncbi:MAG TPA: ABC transporter permease, partial [Gemmatimonadaceae bacterium]|nr:ABC transporter permease [Gemmatimonadaceae bacterium]
MSFWDGWRYRIGAVLHPRRRARDREREMDYHLELDAAQRTHAARGALSSRDARLQARRKFGNVTYLREETRRMSAPEWLDVIERDLRFAGRSVRRAPAFTVAVVLTFALGIGANAAMFSVLDRMLFRPPPRLTDPGRVHRIYLAETVRGKEYTGPPGEYARYADIARWTSSFDRVAGFAESDIAVGSADDSREMRVAMLSGSFFGLFDAPPALGRYFGPAEDVPGHGEHVAVASYATWQTAYGGRPDILGSTVRIGATVYDVVGVAGNGFVGLWPSQPPAYFIPLATYGDDAARTQLPEPDRSHWWATYHWSWMNMIARTKPGVSDATANADLTQAFVKSAQAERIESPNMPPIASLRLRAMAGSILTERGPETSGFAKVAELVGGVAIIVLVIACVNVANLLLTRALRRRREIALRLALGVGRGRLLAQLVTENMLLALAGGVAGLVVAHWGSVGLRLAFLPGARAFSVLGDERTLAFAMAAALGAGFVTSLAPILQANRADLTSDLKSGAREGTYQRSRLRTGLLVAQGALSVLLLVGAGLFVQSLNHVRRIRLGYDVDPVLVVELNMRGVTLDSARAVALRHRLL